MLSLDIEGLKKVLGVIAATFAMLGGGFEVWKQIASKEILKWHPEHFRISSGPVDGTFDVVVAREKLRNDCDVTGFAIEVKDSKYHAHPATPSVTKFSGPANHRVDTFAYTFTIDKDHRSMIAKGTATLLGHINYKCPEGEVAVQYPDHANLRFEIL